MNVNTITIGKDEALQKLAAYRGLNARQKTHEDQRLESLYKMVSNGATVVNIAEAVRTAGLNELNQPKLAIARADWPEVYFHPRCWLRITDNTISNGTWDAGAGAFNDTRFFNPLAYVKTISFLGLFPDTLDRPTIVATVPHVPPQIRPKQSLSHFHILFEVEEWRKPAQQVGRYSRDPFLLRHLSGDLYVIVAEWELTALEASLLGSMRSGN